MGKKDTPPPSQTQSQYGKKGGIFGGRGGSGGQRSNPDGKKK